MKGLGMAGNAIRKLVAWFASRTKCARWRNDTRPVLESSSSSEVLSYRQVR